MSFVSSLSPALPPAPLRRLMASALLAGSVLAIASPRAAAQSADAADADTDHVLVIARTVQPRIAYKALEPQENPVHVQATVFPGRVFHSTLDDTLDILVGEDSLDQRGSAGVSAVQPALATGLAPLGGAALGPNAVGSAPLGAGASIGGAIGGATAGLGDLVTSSVMQAVSPAQQGGGP